MQKFGIVIGIPTISFVFLTILSIIFPSLLFSIFGKFSSNLQPYEIGILGIPLLFSNILLLSLGILYYKNKLPPNIISAINQIRIFEISKKHSTIILLIIISIYIGFSIPELYIDESQQWPDYDILESALEIWPDGKSDNIFVEEQNDRYVRMFILDLSQNLFQNIKILPFIASILVILFTYLLTEQITHKRFPAIISTILIIQSQTFLRFDTVAVYENFWVLFYLLSVYTIQKKWFLSPFFYILSFFTKAFVAPYFVLTLFFTSQSTISRKKKIAIFLSYMLIIGIALTIILSSDTLYPSIIQIDVNKFFTGLSTFGPLLRYDLVLILSILPVVVGLTILSKNNLNHASSMLLLILGTLISGPILVAFTNFYEILPYRYIPLIVFFSISIGLFFSKKLDS